MLTLWACVRKLERTLYAIDETNLPDNYDFDIGYYSSKDDLFRQLREWLGLLVTPSQRKVTVLAVRAAGSL